MQTILELIKDWQSLIGSFITAAVAIIAILPIIAQIKHAANVYQETIKRRKLVSRTTLPIVLSDINKWIEVAINDLKELDEYLIDNDSIVSGSCNIQLSYSDFQFPRIFEPKDFFEYCDEQLIFNFSHILRDIQILNSRLHELRHVYCGRSESGVIKIISQSIIDQYLADAIVCKCRVESLYPFARGESDIVPNIHLSPREFRQCASLLEIEADEMSGIYSCAKKHFNT